MLESELQSTKQSQKLQFKDGYLSKDDQDEVVNSNMEIIRRDGWILDVQRLDGTKVYQFMFLRERLIVNM